MNVLIYGAGEAGTQIADYCEKSNVYCLVGFIDDNSALYDKDIKKIQVYPPEKIDELVKNLDVKEIFIAIPSAQRDRYQAILRKLSAYQVHLRTLPKLDDINDGKVNLEDVKEINIEDLLLRSPVKPISDLLGQNIINKVVLITGAGGSIGSELCRQIIRQMPNQIIIIDYSEFNLFTISEELYAFAKKINFPRSAIFSLLASVSDEMQIRSIVEKFKPSTIFHAAAFKHVSLVENNISAAFKNNIIGTLNVAKAAYELGVKNFTLISTDKAVRPTSVMGMSKRLSEMILQSFASPKFKKNIFHETCFSIVRFGNVLGSSGSVVPIFREQITRGGPVTVTHPEVTRYFMTISEAAELVIQASSLAKGGDMFLLDMGEPVKIYELARKMVWLSGKTVKSSNNPSEGIEIMFTGLKPGEKLVEEMFIVDSSEPTRHPKIVRIQEDFLDWEFFGSKLLEINFNNCDEADAMCRKFLALYTQQSIFQLN
ncbi:nucleoside-diphosphate sugar epimerase/dehydratase [Polynucleobacter sp. JS-Mosq-20-D10]|uniref:polysaccharide biosynthesis protein n=1 Tax=Polynucleobacter sp. JS-Mosq-20-D10 TaxID=2576922 RepID=UPI001BFD52D6|nr:nucleoside-diphosphate sugar epimerase/dehydratase [Polynucleobacter sp. JS-Mosq-20-D10]